jgi:hypothetical protein
MIRSLCFLSAATLATAIAASGAMAQSDNNRVGSAYIPSDAVVTAVLSVANTMSSPAAELYPTEIADAWFKENVGLLASEIDQVKLVVGAPGPSGPMLGMVISLKADLNVGALNPEWVNTQRPMDVDGYNAFELAGPPGMVMHVKNPRTVLLASENYLGSMLRAADAAPTGALAQLAATVPHTATLTAVVAIEPLRPMINGAIQMQSEQIPPPFMEFTRIPNLVDAVFLRVDLQDVDNGLQMVMLAGNESKADEVLGILTNGMRLGQQIFLAQMNEQVDPEDPVGLATQQYMQRISDRYVEMLTPQKNGRRLTMTSKASQSMATQGVLVALLLPAVQSARQAARRMSSSNNLKMLGLAMHNYHDAYRYFPSDITDPDGKPLLSWRVAILPFVEELALYDQFKKDEPWDSPHNLALLEKMPAVFNHPGMNTKPGTTVYQRPVGEGFLNPHEKLRFAQISDGTSNTIMGLETLAQDAVPWTKPADISLDDDNPVALLDDGTREGFNVLLADGAVLFISNAIDPEMLRGLLTRGGGELVQPGGLR